ncbi:MAG: ATP-dependent Clp protease adapter ClpS [Arenimonas sp.]|nr:ATP-dependent Clp protease adapter ClpS [Arenimonas sp.]
MSQPNDPQHQQQGGLLFEAVRSEAVPPGKFQLILLNDDFTPMDFVVYVLQEFFSMNQEMATQVMLQIHTRGRGVCGAYSREVAESKLNQVNDFSRQNHHPLLCIMEPL